MSLPEYFIKTILLIIFYWKNYNANSIIRKTNQYLFEQKQFIKLLIIIISNLIDPKCHLILVFEKYAIQNIANPWFCNAKANDNDAILSIVWQGPAEHSNLSERVRRVTPKAYSIKLYMQAKTMMKFSPHVTTDQSSPSPLAQYLYGQSSRHS